MNGFAETGHTPPGCGFARRAAHRQDERIGQGVDGSGRAAHRQGERVRQCVDGSGRVAPRHGERFRQGRPYIARVNGLVRVGRTCMVSGFARAGRTPPG
jgi:hypothetical protein